MEISYIYAFLVIVGWSGIWFYIGYCSGKAKAKVEQKTKDIEERLQWKSPIKEDSGEGGVINYTAGGKRYEIHLDD